MKIDDIAARPAPSLQGTGPLSEVVISSRIRLARNLAGYPFLSRATDDQKQEIVARLRGHVDAAATSGAWEFLEMAKIEEIDQQILVERHLISRQHASSKGFRAVSVSRDEFVSVMINEEDHLRMQVLRSGLVLDEIWEEISRIDDRIEEKADFAFHPRYGFLTACPTNVGTGIRVSVMLHLPALKLTGELERVFRAARDMRLAVRGLFGEGTEASGDFFQVSNQVTLGRTEEEIINDFKHLVIPKIIDYENRARKALLQERAISLDDRIWRSFGILRHARSISSEETMLHLSHLRLGIHMGRLGGVSLKTVNDLFLLVQPGHLQKLCGGKLTGEQRGAARADLIRKRLETSV